MSKDIRLRTLEHFRKLNVSTEERIANEWLAGQHYDLGTIRRALIELVDKDYLAISGSEKLESLEWLQREMNSETSKLSPQERHAKKSSMRLLKEVGGFTRVPDIRLHTTINGIAFIEKYSRDRNEVWIRLLLILLGFCLGLLGDWLRQ